MAKVDYDTALSVARTFHTIKEDQSDHDHVGTIEDALETLWDLHGRKPISDIDTDKLDDDDVETTFEFLEDYAPTRNQMNKYRSNNDERHPERSLNYVADFVDTEERYVNGCLPSVRDWDVEYVRDGDVIEERTYKHDDEIPTDPVINGVRHECDRTKRGDGEVKVYVSKDPIRNDVDIVINAEGSDFINLEAHNGPNVPNNTKPIEELGEEFNWGMLGETEIIIREDPQDVIDYISSKGWEYDRDH